LLLKDVKLAFDLELDGDDNLKNNKIIKLLANKDNHHKLKALTNKYIKDVNDTSMCLYSGQLAGQQNNTVSWSAVNVKNSIYLCSDNTECGWIGTGDHDLKFPASVDAFHDHFSELLKKIVTFMIPHHGSRYNFSPKAINWIYPTLFFVNCPSSNVNHPHKDTIKTTASFGRPMVRVQESNVSALREEITLRIPASEGCDLGPENIYIGVYEFAIPPLVPMKLL